MSNKLNKNKTRAKRSKTVVSAADPVKARLAKIATGGGGFGGHSREAGMLVDFINTPTVPVSSQNLETYRTSYAYGLDGNTGAYDVPGYFAMMNQQNGGLLYWPVTLHEKYSWYRYWSRCFTNPNVLITREDGTESPLYSFKPGDRVINAKGEITQIKEVTSRYYVGEVVKLDVADNMVNELEVTPEHPFKILRSDNKDYTPEWIEAKDIKEGDCLIVPNHKYNQKENTLVPVQHIYRRNYQGLIWNFETIGENYEDRTFLVYGMATHNTDAYIGRALELMSDLPMSKLTLNMPRLPKKMKKLQKEITDFFAYQLDLINMFELCQGILWEYNCTGNCFKGDTLITTSNGVVPISDIREGDMVLDADGNYSKVSAITRRQAQERLVDVNIARMSGIEFSPTQEHPVLVLRNGKEEMINASEIVRGDWIGVGGISVNKDTENISWWEELEKSDFISSFYGSGSITKEDVVKLKAKYQTPSVVSEDTEKVKHILISWLKGINEPVTKDCYELAEELGISDPVCLITAAYSLRKKGIVKIERTNKDRRGGSNLTWYPYNGGYSRINEYGTNRNIDMESSIGLLDIDEDFLYLLGYWLGDGWLWEYKHNFVKPYLAWDICINKNEEKLYERVLETAKRVFGEENVSNDSLIKDGIGHVVVEDPLFCMWWGNNFGSDCQSKKLPKWIMELPAEKVIWVLRGMIDSDGFVASRDIGCVAGISSTNKNLILQLFHLGIKCGIPFTFSKTGQKKVSLPGGATTLSRESFCLSIGLDGYYEKLTRGCEKHIDAVWSDRCKSNRQDFLECDGRFYYRVRSIGYPFYSGFVYNFEVEGSHTYCANGVRTHNCYLFLEWNETKKLWSRAVMLPPEEVYIFQYPFSENKRVEYRPERLIKMIQDGIAEGGASGLPGSDALGQREEIKQKILENLPQELIDMVRENGCIVMDTDPMTGSFVHHIARRKSPYLDLGSSVLERVLVPMLQKEHYKYCQLSLASRNMTPKNLVTAPGLMPEEVDNLRTQIDLSYLDPEYSVITNYDVNWQQIGASDRLIDMDREYERIENQIFAAMGVTRELMTGEGTFTGSKITVEILNTMFLMSREILKNFIERKLFVPICEAHHWYEEDSNGVKRYWYPEIGFNRITIRDNAEVFDNLFQLYLKGSLPVDVIYELFNLNSDEINAKLRSELFTVKDPTNNRMVEEVNSEVGRKIVDRTDVLERVVKYLGLKLKPENTGMEDGSGSFEEGYDDLQGELGVPPVSGSDEEQVVTPADGDDLLTGVPAEDIEEKREKDIKKEKSEKPSKNPIEDLAEAIKNNLPFGADGQDISAVVDKISELEGKSNEK